MGSNVNHPAHYGGDTTYEAIKVIEAWELGFRLGNVVKYIRRVGHKGHTLENLQKARWYLDREIADVERQLNIPRAPPSTDPLSADAAKRKYVGITSESGHSIALASTLPTDAAKRKDEFVDFKS